jgi:hypothetical protein
MFFLLFLDGFQVHRAQQVRLVFGINPSLFQS